MIAPTTSREDAILAIVRAVEDYIDNRSADPSDDGLAAACEKHFPRIETAVLAAMWPLLSTESSS